MTRVFLGVTGASGAPYAATALRALTAAGCEVGLCVSRSGAHVINHELFHRGTAAPADPDAVVREFVAANAEDRTRVTILGLDDLTAPFASGSSLAPGALICPCSGSTLAAIAHGTARNLIHRCADVMLKERRTLVLMTRETPLSLIHIDNMATVTRAGAVVMPAMPGFYTHPASVQDLVDFMVGKALDHLGVPHRLLQRWGEVPTVPDAPPPDLRGGR
ncbi:MAG: UbiX family flavin prenyltransferase [Thermoleophilia bacterium]